MRILQKFLIQVEQSSRGLQNRMANHTQEPIEARPADLTQLRDRLQRGFSSVGSDVGLDALRNLVHEYEQIQILRMKKIMLPPSRLIFLTYESEQIESIILHENQTDSLSTSRIFALAEETYTQGLSILADVLRLTQVIQTSNPHRLNAEIEALENEIESLKRHGAPAARVEIKEATIRSHKRRLELLGLQQPRLDELFYQADSCEASLARTRVELAVLNAGTSETKARAVTETLQRTIDQAKEVQAELKTLGF